MPIRPKLRLMLTNPNFILLLLGISGFVRATAITAHYFRYNTSNEEILWTGPLSKKFGSLHLLR